ncbi:MAG: Asp-tRNA(Asn)/Glu-tRNA(Gln) amidotransferase GatCAB subunit C [Bacteroidetes bacterium]|nr:MAG: Asp-tRNA(Asn)/Glu-tRNA(Gln) amidotransferase GatCAB subunit C [Bacteroidota bacterium]
MIIDDKKVEDLAHLARLEFSDNQKQSIKSDLVRIIEFCDKLNEVNTEGVEPLIYLSDQKNILRQDISKPGLSKLEVLKNAPSADSDYFKVPKVITK